MWDPRLSSGAGGYAYTSNPALLWAWVLTSPEYGRIEASKIDWTSVTAVANAKDTTVEGVASSYLGVTLCQRKAVRQHVAAILAQGCMVDRWSLGRWSLTCERGQAEDVTIDDSYLLDSDGNGLPSLVRSSVAIESIPTEVVVAFPNAANSWKEEYQKAKAPGVVEGTVPSRVSEQSCPWITHPSVAARYAEDTLEDAACSDRITLQCKRKALRIEPGDIVKLATSKVADGAQGTTVTRTETSKTDWDAGTMVGTESTAGGDIKLTAPTAPAPTFARASVAYDRDDCATVKSGTARYSTVGARAALTIEEGTTNLLTTNQASVATNLSGLSSYASGGSGTFSRDTTQARAGSASAKLLNSGATSQHLAILSSATRTAVTAGTSYTGSVWARATGGTSWRVILWWFASGGSLISSTAGTASTPSTSWTRLTVSGAAPTGAVTAYISLEVPAVAAAGAIWWDCAQLEAKAYPTTWQLPGTARVAEDITLDSDILPLTAGTIRGRFRVTDVTTSHYGPLVTFGTTGTRLLIMRDGTALKVFENNGSAEIVPAGGTIAANTVYSFAYTWGPAGRFLYLNGVQVGTNGRTAALVKPPDGYIGRWLGSHYLDGDICDVEVLRVQETGANIATWHARTATTPDLNTVYHLPLGGSFDVGFGGYRTSPDLSLSTVRTLARALAVWEGTTDAYSQVRVDASVDGGSTWVTVAPTITSLAKGADMQGVTLKLRQVLTSSKTTSIPTMALLTVTAIAQLVGWRVLSAQTNVVGPVQLTLAPRYTPSQATSKTYSTGGVLVDRTDVVSYPSLPDPGETAPAVGSLSLSVLEGETAGAKSYTLKATWTLSASSFVTGYLVELEVGGVTTTVGTVPADTTEFQIPVRTPGQAHTVWVTPLTRNSTEGVSASATETPGDITVSVSASGSFGTKVRAPLQERKNLAATHYSGWWITLSWSASGSTSEIREYRVYRNGKQVATVDADQTSVQLLSKHEVKDNSTGNASNQVISACSTADTYRIEAVLKDGNVVSSGDFTVSGSGTDINEYQTFSNYGEDLVCMHDSFSGTVMPAVGAAPGKGDKPWRGTSDWLYKKDQTGQDTPSTADGTDYYVNVTFGTAFPSGVTPRITLGGRAKARVWHTNESNTGFKLWADTAGVSIDWRATAPLE